MLSSGLSFQEYPVVVVDVVALGIVIVIVVVVVVCPLGSFSGIV